MVAGIIQPSSGPFSRPMLHVKKMDYKALNKVTILDKFPISVIEVQRDELHGGHNFLQTRSKIELSSDLGQSRRCSEDGFSNT